MKLTNKQRKQVWRIFWRNKWEESKVPVISFVSILCFCLLFLLCVKFYILLMILLILLIGVVVFALSQGMIEWLRDNWKKAKREVLKHG